MPTTDNDPDQDMERSNAVPQSGPLEYGCCPLSPLPWNRLAKLDYDGGSDLTSVHSVKTLSIRKELAEASGQTGCFVEGIFTVFDEAAYVIECWRKDPARAEQTTETLRQLGIVPQDWTLHSVSNLHWLSPAFHKALDVFGLWSWCISRDTIAALLVELRSERAARQNYHDQSGRAPWRQWDERWLNPKGVVFTFILLHPWLPEGHPIVRRDADTMTFLYGHREGLLRQDTPDGPSWLEVPVKRLLGHELNPFLIALSCLHKLEAYFTRRRHQMRSDSSSCHYSLYLALLELSQEIWAPLNPPTSATEASSATARASGPVDHAVRTSEFEEPSMFEAFASDEGSEVGPDPTPLDALAQMSTSERVAFGNSLFFKELEPLEDESD